MQILLKQRELKAAGLIVVVLFAAGIVVAAAANRVNEVTTTGVGENLILNASGSYIYAERDFDLGVHQLVTTDGRDLIIEPADDMKIALSGGDFYVEDDAGQIALQLKAGSTNGHSILRLADSAALKWEIGNAANDADKFYLKDDDGTYKITIDQEGSTYFSVIEYMYLDSDVHTTQQTRWRQWDDGGDPYNAFYLFADVSNSSRGRIGINVGNEVASITGYPHLLLNSLDDLILPNADNEESLGNETRRFADFWSVLVGGLDICFANNICMTETVNDLGQIDIGFVYGLPTQEQRDTMALWVFPNYEVYVNSHMTDEEYISGQRWNNDTQQYEDLYDTRRVFDDTMTEYEFNTRRATIDNNGKPDFTFGRAVRMSLRDVQASLERLDEIEETLCNSGASKYC